MRTSPLLRLLALSTVGSIGSLLSAATPVREGWFEWPYAEPLAGSALDTSALNHKPAGVHGRVVVRGDHFVTADDGQRIRFWGCNLSSNESFVDAATADRLARRLAQGGINIARLHHLDNSWSVDSGGSLWKPGTQDRVHIDAAQLDKLHRVVAALKAQGIYSNVNLKVSRTLTEADGFPASIAQTPGFQKRIDYFQRRIIDLQKDYARQLLTARNPYTGMSLAEDPAVAVIELNNENSLLGMRTRELGDGLETLPEPFLGELTALWNAWLLEQYKTDAKLATVWNESATPIGQSSLSSGSRWLVDSQPGNDVVLASDSPSTVHLHVKSGDGVRFHAAAFLDQLKLKENETYTLTFAARADQVRPIEVAVSRDEAGWRTDKWRTRGLRQILTLKPEWQEFRLVFTTHSIVDVGSRLSVLAGHMLGEVWLKNVRLESGSASAGLREGQSLKSGTVPIPTDATPRQWNDYLTFLAEVERRYVEELREYLHNELKVRAPIVCTQANYGGIAGLVREKASDFIDTHAYWQHPDWGNATSVWDTTHYTINNTSQIAEFGPRWFGEFGGIALLRVTGKPFTLTETDYPAPTDYAAEMYPVLATFGGLQDWDAIFTFDQVGTGAEKDDGAIRTYFDQSHHPAKWSFGPFATRVFRQGLVPPPESRRELFVSTPLMAEANHVDVLWLKTQTAQDLGFLTDRLSVNENLLGPDQRSHVERHGESRLTSVRLQQATHGVVYVASMQRAAAIVGFIGGAQITLDDLAVKCDEFGINYAAVGAVALDERPLASSGRVLVTLAARAENQGSEWNAARTSIGNVWGKGGVPIAERVPATIKVRSAQPRKVRALRPDGRVAAEVVAAWANGWLSFSTREGPATLQYELVEGEVR